MILEKVVVGQLEVNCYILGCAQTKDAVVIDPGDEPEKINRCIEKHKLKVKFVLNTHGHGDHIGADASFGVPVYIHRLDAEFLTNPNLNLSGMLGTPVSLSCQRELLEDGQKIKLGTTLNLEVMHTPGHTPGGICLNVGDICFTGDTLFAQGVGRTDIPGASESDLSNSIKSKLLTLPDEVIIYPGHGPSSTIGREKELNPFL